jgi:predicted acylesterase/phospholipase RssA
MFIKLRKLNKMKKKRLGIVLSGGGAKGAFELGFLKSFLPKIESSEYELAGVSGTSIGALIGAYLASGQLEELIDIWASWGKTNCPLTQAPWYGPIANMVVKGNMYESEPVKKFLLETLDTLSLKNSPISYYNTRVRLSDGFMVLGGNKLGLPETSQEGLILGIMASMALIPGTSPIKINGINYADGGFRDTIPVKSLIDQEGKFDKIIVVGVNPPERKWNTVLNNDYNGIQTLVERLLFVFWDILWDENSRSDIEIGQLKHWNKDTYQVVMPKEMPISTTDFDSKLTIPVYQHGFEIGSEVTI